MKPGPLVGVLIALVCCGLAPALLLGGAGILAGTLPLAAFSAGLGVMLVAYLVWSQSHGANGGKANPQVLIALVSALIAIVVGLTLVSGRSRGRNPVVRAPLLQEIGVPTGSAAPDFHLADAYGRPVTRASLVADRPGLMFFTTTYCLPCIEGLQALNRFQLDVGVDRFRVLIVFVDPREGSDDLQTYRVRNQFPQSWYYALDTDGLLPRYRVRSLDTKFVLDRQGIVRFADIYPARYETWQEALATVGISR